MTPLAYRFMVLLVSAVLSLAAANVDARNASFSKRINGIDIHMGITLTRQAEQKTVAQNPVMMTELRGKKHLITIGLFDSKTGQRITDASVIARIGEVGMSRDAERLIPTQYGDAVYYGRDFYLVKSGPHWIDLKVQRKGGRRPTIVRFEWNHF